MAKKSEFELDVEEKAWHLLSLLLKTGHPLLPQHLSSQCRLFSASPSFIAHVISLPSSPLSFTDNGLVAPSASAVFALGRFFSLTTAPIGFRDLEPIVLRKRKGTMDDLVELPLPAPKRTFFFSSLREQGGRDERRLAIIDQSYADAAKANRVGLIGSGTERGKQTPIETHMEEYPSLNRNLSEEINMRSIESIDEENRLSVEELDAAPSNETVDCRSAFTTEEIFPTRDDLVTWARAIGRENGFVVTIIRSDTENSKRKARITLGCDRSRKYTPKRNDLTRKLTVSKKCECPFKLRGRPLENGEGWKVHVMCGFHNHEISKTLAGHPYAGRLSVEEKSLLEEMAKNMVKPKRILHKLKDYNKDNCTTIHQVYSACRKIRRAQKAQNISAKSEEISGN